MPLPFPNRMLPVGGRLVAFFVAIIILCLPRYGAAQTPLVSTDAVWKYLDQNVYPGSAWTELSFNDAGWPSGTAPLGYGDPVTTVINGGPSNARYITTYFRHQFVAADAVGITNLVLRVRRDDGVAVYLNGFELFRDNLPSGVISAGLLASIAIAGWDESDYSGFSIPATHLLNGTNILAVEVHQVSGTSSDLSFALELSFNRSEVPLLNVIADSAAGFSTNQGQNGWFYGYFREPDLNQASFLQLETARLYNMTRPGWTHPNYAPPWTLISTHSASPAAPAYSGITTEYAVRRFVPTQSASVRIRNSVRLYDTNTAGDGVLMTILNNNQTLLSRSVSSGNPTEYRDEVSTTLNAGQPLDFVVAPNVNDGYDFTYSVAQILGTPPVTLQPPITLGDVRLQLRPGTSLVDVYFNLSVPVAYGALDIVMDVSTNGSRSFDLNPADLSGDFGTGVPAGANRHIVWAVDQNWFTQSGSNGVVRLRASAIARNLSALATIPFVSAGVVNLTVDRVQFAPASVSVGQSLALTFRVRNAGTNSSPATVARLLVSTDALINAGDSGLSPLNVAIPALAAGGVFTYSGTVTPPADTLPGAYYVGVWADPNRLLNTTILANTIARSASRLTVVGSGPPSLRVSPPASAAIGSGSVSTFTIRNAGGGSLSWSAAISGSAPWIHFVPAASGVAAVNGSSLIVSSDLNPTTSPRTGTITISAPGATPASQIVTVTQSGSVAGPAAITGFVFSAISSPQPVNDEFSVTITAMNNGGMQTAFNGRVNLRAEHGGVPNLAYVQLLNGVWSGSLNINAPSEQAVLVASTMAAEGRSGEFALTTAAVNQQFTVAVSSQSGPLNGALVKVQSPVGGAAVITQFTDSKGLARFEFPTPRPVIVLVTRDGFANHTSSSQAANGVKHDVIMRTSKPPVIFVPGIMGSRSDYKWIRVSSPPYSSAAPILPPYPAGSDALVLHDSPVPFGFGEVGWNPLRELLKDSFEVFDAPYDWRMPAIHPGGDGKVVWREYLLPKIREAKQKTGAKKVTIVAHSTGGLLARAYIQSDEYTNDVEKLAMIATPNEGSANAYYLWFGGDTSHDDGFYAGTSRYNYDSRNPEKWDKLSSMQKIDFYRTVMRELEDLLPVYDKSLIYRDTKVNINDALQTVDTQFGFPERYNNPLYSLNQGSFDRFVDHPVAGKVVTKVFYSGSESTIGQIVLARPDGAVCSAIYPHGKPVEPPQYSLGDGTVRTSSVTMGPAKFSLSTKGSGKHAHLVKAFATDIATFLGVNSSIANDSLKKLPANVTSPSSQLLVSLRGRSQAWLVNPAFAGVGIEPESNQYTNDWTLTTAEVGAASSLFTADNPPTGLYQGTIKTTPGEVLSLDVVFYETNAVFGTNVTWIGGTNSLVFSFQIDPVSSNALIFSSGPAPPANPRCFMSNSLSALAWDASPSAGVTGYHIYARRDDETLYQPLTTTANLSYTTPHPWMSGGLGTNWFYAVVAVAAGGVEGPYTTLVDNSAPTLANFIGSPVSGTPPLVVTFTNTSSGGVTNWAWDFNSDGVVDSTEQNPTTVFADTGGYTVTLTVTGPEGTDTRVAVGFISVSPPTLMAVGIMPDGTIGFDLLGQAGRSYDIQASTNLVDWTTLTNLAVTNATTIFRDGAVTNQPWRFYRAVVP